MFKNRFIAAALGALVLAGALTASAGQAEAGRFHGHRWHRGHAWHGGWGFHGGCRWVGKFNRFGDYVGSVRICRW